MKFYLANPVWRGWARSRRSSELFVGCELLSAVMGQQWGRLPLAHLAAPSLGYGKGGGCSLNYSIYRGLYSLRPQCERVGSRRGAEGRATNEVDGIISKIDFNAMLGDTEGRPVCNAGGNGCRQRNLDTGKTFWSCRGYRVSKV